jgi:hypothetical protein
MISDAASTIDVTYLKEAYYPSTKKLAYEILTIKCEE